MKESNATMTLNEQPIYTTELAPHRSLGRRGLKILFAIAGALSVVHVIFFMTTGAWPIALFFGADFVALFGAFWLNNRAARAREHISLSRMELSIRKISPAGLVRESRYNPFWARLKIARHPEIGVTSIKVSGEGRETGVGDFLYPEARERFASDFTRALATVKQRI
ncbi:DUF2244 domain-containing protein [Rhizobium sp. L1K21]|uniref:DUF2244 domain-containing protein n=1 Tax=Rhizobium sp. L1K21 TaxID=2954933 RepID=UPI00209226AA|nr:DUF2244 domain-containing protein [Rhizobium sp. L1K21]MCO6187462.1 DUF2244 domain-containing protein [Rhizobium sp. L1K21]